jgi:RNA polymerase sigma-70 factor, ECF subfamily
MARDPLERPEPLIRRVYAYAAYRLGEGADAEDVTSEVFENAVRYRSSYDPKRGEPIAWLMGIARRCVGNALAERALQPSEVTDAAAPGDLAEQTAERLLLASALATLSERDQELIALRFGADLRPTQIAWQLEFPSTNSAEVAIHRAVGRLREELRRQDETRGRPAPRQSSWESSALL